MYVRAVRPAFARPCVGIHKSTSLMSSSLLLQQCPACLVRLTWIVFADQAETLLHSLERAAASIGLYVNAHKTEYMCYNQTGDISTLEGTPLKLVDKFTYLGSSVESTEKDIETRLTKAWTAINRLSIIWKSDLTDKMKRSFFQAAVTSILLYGCTTWTLTKRMEKKLDGNYTRMLRAILKKSWQQHPTRHQLYGHIRYNIYIYIYMCVCVCVCVCVYIYIYIVSSKVGDQGLQGLLHFTLDAYLFSFPIALVWIQWSSLLLW